MRTILDHTREVDPDRGAAQVATFCVLAFSELRDAPLPEFALEGEGVEGRGSAITILDLWIYLMHRSDQALARANEELAELRERLESQCAARHHATPRVPVDWSAFYASMVRLPLKPRDLRLN